MEFSLINQILVFFIDIVGSWLAFLVYSVNKKKRVNQLFSLMTIFILLWVTFGFFANILNQTSQILLCLKLNLVAVFLFFIAMYFFSVYFPKEKKRYPILDKIVLVIGLIFIPISIFTDLIIKSVEFKEWGANVVFGKGENVFFAIIVILTFLILFNLFRKYFILSKREKLKVQYFLIGIALFALFNLIFNVVFPIIRGTYEYYQFGDYSAIFFLGFTAFAIVKRELFDIRVVLTQLLVGVIGLILFVQSIVAETFWQKVFGLGLFILFCIFGWFLIRSVLKEIELRKELEKAYKELKKLDEAKTEFLSIASHQLRSPLTVIKGYISMALSGNYGKVEGKTKGFLKNVYISSERLIDLVNNLLNVTRIQMGKMKFEFQDIQIEDIIKDTVKDFLPQAKGKGLSLKFEKPILPQSQDKKLPKIKADSQKIRQVILNLVDNAIKYTEKGEIKVSAKLKVKSKKIQIVIEDTGIGLKKEEINDIFKIFDRGAEAPQVNTGGSGVGLYVAKEMVKVHKGRIWAESRKKGSRFIVELPVAHE